MKNPNKGKENLITRIYSQEYRILIYDKGIPLENLASITLIAPIKRYITHSKTLVALTCNHGLLNNSYYYTSYLAVIARRS
jgi:hypothetical protein